MKRLVVLLALVACGGKIDTGDAGSPGGTDGGQPTSDGSTPDVIVSPPPTPTCSPMSGIASTDPNGNCEITEAWGCGDVQYEVDCSCPSAQCTCSEATTNGGSATAVQAPSVCPKCGTIDFAALCGFPSN